MLIGAMNNPANDLLSEIQWMADLRLDFIDLTLEPPGASAWQVDARELRAILPLNKLGVVGHTAWYLPFCSPFESLRRAAIAEATRAIQVFGVVGAQWVNIHPDHRAPMHDRRFIVERNLEALRELLPIARANDVRLMVENLPGSFNTAAQLGELLNPLPDLGLLLDIGHANLMNERNPIDEILDAFGERLRHVHLSDNKGGAADLHLPLGCGNVDVKRAVQALKQSAYDGTITLEVFSPDRAYLSQSRDVLTRLWEEM